MDEILKSLTLDFLGQGKHKIAPENFFEAENAILLDVRSKEEANTIAFRMEYHSNLEVFNIPVHEIPDRINEIPRDKLIGLFCPANIRSAIVYAYLLSKGFSNLRIIEGGYPAFTEALKPGPILGVTQKNK